MSDLLPPPIPGAAAPALPPKPAALPPPTTLRPRSAAPTKGRRILDGPTQQRVVIGRKRGTALPGALMVATYIAVTVAVASLAVHFTVGYRRVESFRGHPELVTPAELAWAARFDHTTVRMEWVALALLALGATATAWWSRRVTQNIATIGDHQVSVGLATVSWFVPLLWFFGGFAMLRKAPRADWPIWSWQFCFGAPFIAYWLVKKASSFVESTDVTLHGGVTATTILSEMRSEWIVSLMFLGAFALATLLATRAVFVVREGFDELIRPA